MQMNWHQLHENIKTVDLLASMNVPQLHEKNGKPPSTPSAPLTGQSKRWRQAALPFLGTDLFMWGCGKTEGRIHGSSVSPRL